MRILNYYGNGRRHTLLTILAAFRAARKGKLEIQVGPLDERLLSSYGVFVSGKKEDVDKFVPIMKREAKKLKIEIEPAEFVGELK